MGKKFYIHPKGFVSEQFGEDLIPLPENPSLADKQKIQKVWGESFLLLKNNFDLWEFEVLSKYVNLAAREGYGSFKYLYLPQIYFKGYIPDPWYINFQAENAGRGIDPYYIGFNTHLERIHKICEYKTQPYCSFSMYTERAKGWRYFVVAGNRQEAFKYIKDFLYL